MHKGKSKTLWHLSTESFVSFKKQMHKLQQNPHEKFQQIQIKKSNEEQQTTLHQKKLKNLETPHALKNLQSKSIKKQTQKKENKKKSSQTNFVPSKSFTFF